jgi:[protein-PII] uridylyltransferase
MATLSISTELRSTYAATLAKIQEEFTITGSGRNAVLRRSQLLDSIVVRLWREFAGSDADQGGEVALVAIGGYGREILFPYSDIDLLFLFRAEPDKQMRDVVRTFSQELWDLKLRLSPQSRTLAQCERFDVNNVEFTIAALDSRYVAGDRDLFSRLHKSFTPRLVVRDAQHMVEELGVVSRARHAKFGNTIFHLEPNVKEGPGGLRDYNVVHWLALIADIEGKRDGHEPEASVVDPSIRAHFDTALEYLFSVRCFLHFRHGRDDNTLRWEAQAEAAASAIGSRLAGPLRTEEWMRTYFRHARAIHRVATQLLEEVPAARSSLYRELKNWRARLSNCNFSVVNGFILLQQPGGVKDPDLLLEMFWFMAQNGLKLSRATEQRVEQAAGYFEAHPPAGPTVWKHLRKLLIAPHAGNALRAMHFLGILNVFVPEMRLIDSLVVRDYYHRFTVDEHSIIAIEALHRLEKPQSEWERHYGELFSELEDPELLLLALLLHDIGKASTQSNHSTASVDAAEKCMERMHLSTSERDTVCFLIANHLELSKALRRDIFDQQTIAAFAARVRTPERLKMLALMTYADIRSVNPEALTPWKADNIWQLYIATANFLNRHVDTERVHTRAEDEVIARVRCLAPNDTEKLESFLEGLPQRYLLAYPAEAVLRHLQLASELNHDSAQLDLKRGRHWFELTLVTRDRPGLFATVAGVLSAWGMNIVKANAFCNQDAVVVDTFYFTDRFGTLELNSAEWERFQKSMQGVLCGEVDLGRLLHGRFHSGKPQPAKVEVQTHIDSSNDYSPRCTVLEIITRDRPRLLYDLTTRLSQHKHNIEIALIDTEGEIVIDVLYVTHNGTKLTREQQHSIVEDLALAVECR